MRHSELDPKASPHAPLESRCRWRHGGLLMLLIRTDQGRINGRGSEMLAIWGKGWSPISITEGVGDSRARVAFGTLSDDSW